MTTAARSGTNWEVHLRQNYKIYKTERLGSLRGLVMMLTLLQLDNLSIRRKKIKAQLMFKILKGNARSYLKSLFSVRTLEYDFRNNRSKLNIPKPRTNYLKRSICYSGALLWNNLPQEIRNLPNLSQFKRATNDCYVDI